MATIKGGTKIKAALREIARKFQVDGTLRVGFLEGSTYPDGTSVPMVAAVQNFGAPSRGIPPRPFFSDMVAAKSPGWPAAIGEILRTNGGDGAAALELMGEGIKGQLQASIVEGQYAPLAESTIAAKGFDKPLIETSHMVNSVDYEVAE